MRRLFWVLLVAALAVPLVAATVDFKANVVTVDAGKVLKPAGTPVEAKGWAYAYVPTAGRVRVLIELPDGSTVVASTATLELAKGKVGFVAVRTQVQIKDAAEVPQQPELEAVK